MTSSAAPAPDVIRPLAARSAPAAPKRPRRRLGRPEGVSGEDTRRRILDAARECFAAYGYAATSNRIIAERAGLTPAAVYHHFGRKSDLMLAVYQATEAESYARMRAALAGQPGLIARVQAVLDVLHDIVVEDRSRAVFMFVALEESRRHEELAKISFDGIFAGLFAEIVDQAIADHEVAPEGAKYVRGVLVTLVSGLAHLGAEIGPDAHRAATEGCKALIAGTLLATTPQPAAANGRRTRSAVSAR